jgi:proteic killer suppression protein
MDATEQSPAPPKYRDKRNDLMKLPSNRFEALRGDRKGQFSIRINQQWRLCFEWPDEYENPFNIEITDHHITDYH